MSKRSLRSKSMSAPRSMLPADDPLLKSAKRQAGGSAGEMSASLKGPVKRYVLDFAVDMHDLQVSEGDDGVAKGQIEFVAIAYDAAGKRLNYVDRGVAYKLQPQQLQAGLRTGFPWHIELDLPAGKESVRVAVHDPVNGPHRVGGDSGSGGCGGKYSRVRPLGDLINGPVYRRSHG